MPLFLDNVVGGVDRSPKFPCATVTIHQMPTPLNTFTAGKLNVQQGLNGGGNVTINGGHLDVMGGLNAKG